MLYLKKPEFYPAVFLFRAILPCWNVPQQLSSPCQNKEQAFSGCVRKSGCLVVCPLQNLSTGRETLPTAAYL